MANLTGHHNILAGGSLGACLIALVVTAGAAQAQETVPAPAVENPEPASGDVIVVTANRTEQSSHDVPLAVNVMDPQQLKDTQVRNVNDVLTLSPGAFFQSGSPDEQTIGIRGISADIYGASGDASVLTLIDGIPITRSWMRSGAVFDLQRVEVDRGPQGTSFGRNATAGTVNFITNGPVFRDTGYVTLRAGNYDTLEGTAVVNQVVSEDLAVRLSSNYSRRDGYFRDEISGRPLDNANSYALRLQALYEPSSDFEVLVRANYSFDHVDVPVAQALYDPTNPVLHPASPPYQPISTDPRVIGVSDGQFFDRTLWDIGAQVRLGLGELNLTSHTNFRRGEVDAIRDVWGTPLDVLIQESSERADIFQEELRLDNAGSASAFQWVAGVYYLHENTKRDEQKDILLGGPIEEYQNFAQRNKTNSLGLFANATYQATPTTVASVGARYTRDRKDYTVPFHVCGTVPNPTGDPGLAGGGPAPFCAAFIQNYPTVSFVSGSGSATWSNVSYRLSLTQTIVDGLNVYASYATGYKGGGFGNEPSNSLPISFEPYDPEKVETLEAGVKILALGRTLKIDIAAYSSTYTDIQAETYAPDTGSNIVFNVGGAKIKGLEGEMSWRPTDRLTLRANGAYVHAFYDDPGLVAPDGTVITSGRFTGVPEWTAFLSASYDLPLANGSGLRFYGDLRERAAMKTGIGPQGQPPVAFEGEAILGANVSWSNPADTLTLTAWGRNLTNADDWQYTDLGNGTVSDQTYTTLGVVQGLRRAGPPRTYGLTVDYRF